MKKLLSIATLGALLASSAFGDDFLAKVSNGALSDNSVGVKVLSLNEMKDVKGGYYETLYDCRSTLCYALANHAKSYFTMTPRELTEWKALTYGDLYLFVGFLAQNNWTVSSLGTPYNYFTYDEVLYDARIGQMYKQSKQVLNSNLIVRQLSNQYKDQFDSYLGGLHIGRTR
ncbi:hypothetical protein CQA76_03380 [Campylobacter aviculae]|uniref:Bacteriocin-type signal sequence domain-containing protein n=1 Tax=Campylobacter aviculae TaxID=2510190 RepID=A0A4U7BVZ7_9BACT|nr:hypothetical protein CQA76_03380 [Campylobacter aviculae]